MSVLTRRHRGRHRRTFAAPVLDPNACHCVIHHPRTAEERKQAQDAWLLALIDGNTDLADCLRVRLTTFCPAAELLCTCGCERPLREHNEMRAA